MESKPVHMLLPQTGQPTASAGEGAQKRARLRQVCQQFEAVFVQQLFKGMRDTVPSDGLIESDRSRELFQDMMDQQVAETMAHRQGLGIADALFQRLQQKIEA